jgi:DNA-binding HxlR family transcriptional regulator
MANTNKKQDSSCNYTEDDLLKGLLPIRDTLHILSGKWKLPIIIAISFGRKRFKEIHRGIPGITPRMLSKELKEMEVNQLVKRTVYNTMPVTIEYEMTEYSKSLRKVIREMNDWGLKHRQIIIKRT